ncbi:hypothetical protein [Rhodoferax sp.]|uniref:hypothetical protein n=1 Tax=Rhodoferax sp. TaxID=50421 RepID=UPI002ACEE75A|nr:hypothetical protein [Rhodoferax sp.]MDZ7920240.1 hypothetical protein [Rhodoferax sp.]
MKTLIVSCEFRLVVSMSDLMTWSSVSDGPEVNHPKLQAVLDALGACVDLVPLANAYFGDFARAGCGDVHVFDWTNSDGSAIAIDTYNDPTDQLDLIELFIRCSGTQIGDVAERVWSYFNACEIQIGASQHAVCERLRNALDGSKFPRLVGNSGFSQRQIRHTAVQPFAPADGFAAR